MEANEFEKEHPKLVKNSVIACVIDDLNDGLIVVSFSHEDEGTKVHYQGVLLQISRKRGIPSGISFPVDHAIYTHNSHESSTLDSYSTLESQNDINDPIPLPALSQRSTYFQEKSQGPVTPDNGLRARVGLRRFIKRPARFQNSRMSLRLRNRPVLCAKCRAFCEGLKPIDKKESDSSEAGTTLISKAHGVTTRNRKNFPAIESIVSLTTSSSTNNELTANSSFTTAINATTTNTTTTTTMNSSSSNINLNENLQDYSYVSFGAHDFIENFWKRPSPSLLPEPEKPKKPDKLFPRDVMVFSSSKSVPKKIVSNQKVNLSLPHSPSLANGHLCNNNVESLVTKAHDRNNLHEKDTPKSSKAQDKGLKVKKSKDLKMCISKLNANISPGQEDEMTTTFTTSLLAPTNVSSSLNEATTTSPPPGIMNSISDLPVMITTKNNFLSDEQQLLNLMDGSSSNSSSPTTSTTSMKEDLGSSKMWENRIRKKSAVPARFRDGTYVPKKVFGFKRRRADEDSGLLLEDSENHEASLDLNSHVPPYDNDMRELTLDLHKLSPSSSSDSSHTSTTTMPSSLPTATVTTSHSGQQQGSTFQTNNSSGSTLGEDVVPEGMIGKVMSSKIKTPVIKISFGTGNGSGIPKQQITVEIPRKEAELEETNEKAVRKAMKKAKKEAKRKFHDETLTNNDPTLNSSTSTFITKSVSNIGNNSCQTSSPPILNPEYSFSGTTFSFSNNSNCDDSGQMTGDLNLEPQPVKVMEPIKTPKKKKKEKKRKRHKSGPHDEDHHYSHLEPLNSNTPMVTVFPPSYPSKQLSTTITDSKLVVTAKPCQSSVSLNVTVNKTSGSSSSSSSASLKNPSLLLPKTSTEAPTSPLLRLHATVVHANLAKSISNNQRKSLLVQEKVSLPHDHQNEGNDVIETFVNNNNNNSSSSDSLIQLSSNNISSVHTSTEQPQRVCISLKRLCQNSYVSWDKSQIDQDKELSSSLDLQDTESEINDYPMNDSLTNDRGESNVDSFLTYTDESSNIVYKKDDIVWGKLPKSPWWPGKILGFVTDDNSVRARIMWFRASTMSCIRFSQLCPFTDQFDAKYIRRRRRGQYQLAVRDALIEAHKLDANGTKQLYPND